MIILKYYDATNYFKTFTMSATIWPQNMAVFGWDKDGSWYLNGQTVWQAVQFQEINHVAHVYYAKHTGGGA